MIVQYEVLPLAPDGVVIQPVCRIRRKDPMQIQGDIRFGVVESMSKVTGKGFIK
jgi:hypothetical protein